MANTRNNLNFVSETSIPGNRTILEPFKSNRTTIQQHSFVNVPITPTPDHVIPGEVPSSLLNLIKSEPNQSRTLVHGIQPRTQTQTKFRFSNTLPSRKLLPLVESSVSPNPSKNKQSNKTENGNCDNDGSALTAGTGGGKIEAEEALGGSGVSGTILVRERGGVDGSIGSAIGDVPDGWAGKVGEKAGDFGGAEGAWGVVIEGLVAVALDGLDCGGGGGVFELLFGGDVHAALGDPLCFEAAGGSYIDVRVEFVDEGLEGGPAGLGGVERRHEEVAAAEVIRLEEVERLQNVMAPSAGVEGGPGAAAHHAEHRDVQGTGNGVVGGQRRRRRKK
ncbi:hypothetical protein V8G54_017883 [Vigna mungo]|uniref:Uncharacterized protein n=1 Tax=Vigna mungo TaxID=3915 RepID=A0AAQ3N8K5_VIGMU